MRIRPDIAIPTLGAVILPLAMYVAPGHSTVARAPQTVQPPPAFAQCRACHSVVKNSPSGVGPNLFGVSGAPAAAKPGYAYSPAMKASKIRWDRARMDAYLANPKGLVPGTKMMSPPVRDAARRKEIIDYLEKLK